MNWTVKRVTYLIAVNGGFQYILQPPKKGKKGKKKGKKSAKPKTPTVIDGMSTEEMSKEEVGCFELNFIRIP